MADERHCTPHDLVDVCRFQPGLPLVGEIEQSPNNGSGAGSFLANDLQVFLHWVIVIRLLQEQAGKAHDTGQGVVDFMGHAGGQFADGRQFGRLDELGLGLLQFLHPVLQVLVQPRVLDSDSRRLGHRRQQCHIGLAEITPGFVHSFDHPDHFPLDLQRDSKDRPGDETGGLVNIGVEARVLPYVGYQQPLAFPCYPSGDALPQWQSEALYLL